MHRTVTAIVLMLTPAIVVSADIRVDGNIADGYDPNTGYRSDIGVVSSNIYISNLTRAQQFDSGIGGWLTRLDAIIQRHTTGVPLEVTIHREDGGLPGTAIGSVSVSSDTILTNNAQVAMDLSSAGILLQPNTKYYAAFGANPPTEGLGHYSFYNIHPNSPFGQDVVTSRDGGATWSSNTVGDLGELPLSMYVAQSAFDTQEFAPSVDAIARLNDGVFEISTDEFAINTQKYDAAEVDRRGIVEFDLSELASDAAIMQASITFDISSYTYGSHDDGPEARLFAYAGDGAADITDVFQTHTPLAITPTVTSMGEIQVDLDEQVIAHLLATGEDHLGVLILGSEDGHQFGFDTTESEAWGFGLAPRLSLTYEVPEPVTLSLMMFGGLAAMLCRRHHRVAACSAA